jgi:hypothetical protein
MPIYGTFEMLFVNDDAKLLVNGSIVFHGLKVGSIKFSLIGIKE